MMNLAVGLAGFVAAVLVLRAAAYRAMARERPSRSLQGQEIELHIRTDSPQTELPFVQGEVIRIGKVAAR
jgi:hypothetical protein